MKRQFGFTLLELMVLVLLLSIASHLMLPNLQMLLQHNKTTQLKDLLVSHLNFARSQAILGMTRIEVCGSANGQRCDQQWQQGWLIRTAEGTILHEQRHAVADSRLAWRGFSAQLTFLPNGTSHASNGQFHLCDRHGQLHWQVILNRQGRVRTQRAENGSLGGC